MAPLGGALMYGSSHLRHLVCHCLLLELDDRLVLVDSGIGLADLADPKRRLGTSFVNMVRPSLAPEQTAAQQIESMGFAVDDVRDVILTHLDVDHAGGISDFPFARVHVTETELARANDPRSRLDRMRYRPLQWSHGPRWARYHDEGSEWFGFPAVRDLVELPPEILLVPLAGHTGGHTGVAIDTGARWLLHCGDAYFHRGVVDASQPREPVMLRMFERFVAADDALRRHNSARLAELFREHRSDVALFCAHDPEELERLQS